MGGQKFQYDESGGTFFYFLLSFLALLLVPSTYYWWPRKTIEDPTKYEKDCHCKGCKKKQNMLKASKPWQFTKQLFTKFIIILGWVLLALLAYKVSQFDYEYANFDPYEILGVPLSASQGDIKRAYKTQSLVLHPDKKTGDEKAFMKLTKAYQALTDAESRMNWEKYGNPDGPGAMSFGIALPAWIVEKENSVWVLGLYALVFMIALPTVVGIWWYRSIQYTADQVLLATTEIYFHFVLKTPSMALKRVILVLSASFEFEKQYNKEIVERPTDNIEYPQIMKQLSSFGEKNRESPICYTYALRARVLMFAHLSRIPLPEKTLDLDRMYIIKKCPYLLREMVNCVAQVITLAYARRVSRLPSVETIENCMKLCPMIVQGMWDYKSPLLQLPYVGEEHLKFFMSRKRLVKTIQQFVQLRAEDRRSILRFLDDDQYEDVMKVAGQMPLIDFQVRSEVIDDEASTVFTAGAIVTVSVTLVRKEMKLIFGGETSKGPSDEDGDANKEANDEDDKDAPKKPVWQKQQRKGTKKSSKKAQSQKKQHKENKSETKAAPTKKDDDKEPEKKEKPANGPSTNNVKKETSSPSPAAGDSSGADESDLSEEEPERSEDEEPMEDDEDWSKFQSTFHRRDRVLEGKSKVSHTVHSPYFPEEKQEYWWVYVSDRKSRTLLTPPVHVTDLVDREEVQLKFTAPRWPGVFIFTVCLRSDSYLGFDQTQDIKLDVKEAPEVPLDHPQWDMSGEEEEETKPEGEPSDISEFATDDDIDDEDVNS